MERSAVVAGSRRGAGQARRVGRVAAGALVLLGLVALPRGAEAAEQGDVTGTFMLGTNLATHLFAQDGKPAHDTTISDTFGLSQFVGAGVFVTDRLRLGLNFQFTETIVQPRKPYPSSFQIFGLLPQINYNFWGPLTASVVPTILLRKDGVNQEAYGVQGVLGWGIPITKGINAVVAVEVPYFWNPRRTIGVTPLAGVSGKL